METDVKNGIAGVEDEPKRFDMAEVELKGYTLGECPECGREVKDLGEKFACVGWLGNTCSFAFNRADLDVLWPDLGDEFMEELLRGEGASEFYYECMVREFDLKLQRAEGGRWSIATTVITTFDCNLNKEYGMCLEKCTEIAAEENYIAFSV